MDESIVPLSGKNLPLLLVVADVGVDPKSQQGDYNIQVVIRASVVKGLSHQTFCWQRTEEWLKSMGQHRYLGSWINAELFRILDQCLF